MPRILLDSRSTIVIADFDGTFTKKEVMGKKSSALMTVLVDEKYLGTEGVRACRDLFSHYYPIEMDPLIGEEEKSALMHQWWTKTSLVLKESKVTKEMLLEVCRSPLLEWRDDLLDFLNLLAAKNIPLIIFSAGGFGKLAIEYLLEKAGIITDNIKVFSNEIIFDENGYFLEPKPPIIHIANKAGNLLVKNNLLKSKPDRRQCLLIGDGLDDVKMSRGLDFDLVYKVGFNSADKFNFEKLFDLVLPVDGSYKEIIALLD